MTPSPQESVSWCLLLAIVLALVLVAAGLVICRHRRDARLADERIRALRQEIDMRDAEARHLVHTQVPTLLQALWQGREAEVPAPLHPALHGTSFAASRDGVLQQFREVTAQASERAEDGAKAAVSTVSRSMQALLNDTTNAIDAMLRKHDDPSVLADANEIDHASSQLVRRTQIVNVLTGAWPGRQRRNSPLLDVVRGGVSKIRDYDRITITGEPAYSVVSGAVEPVVLAVAELLDNAARHSEPGSDVQVWFVQAHNGVSVMIDDSGVGLKPEAKESATRLLKGEEQVRLTQLGSRPKFGFPVVGVLAQRYGFRVSVDQESIYGGVRAGIFLPSALLTTPDSAEPEPHPHPHPRGSSRESSRTSARQPDEIRAAEPEKEAPMRADGLPQRRRRGGAVRTAPEELAVPTAPRNTSRNVGAFARGIRNARDRRTSDERTNDQ